MAARLRVSDHAVQQYWDRTKDFKAPYDEVRRILLTWWETGRVLHRHRYDPDPERNPLGECRKKGDFVVIAHDGKIITVMAFNPRSFEETRDEGPDPRWDPLRVLRRRWRCMA